MFWPTPGQVGHHRDAKLLQLGRRADPRQQQDMRRAYGPGTQDDLLAFNSERLSPAFDSRAHRAVALKQNLLDVAVGADGQI